MLHKIPILIILSLLFVACVVQSQAQDPVINIELSTPISGNATYKARDYIKLKDGFSYSSNATSTFHAIIDEFMTFPAVYKELLNGEGNAIELPFSTTLEVGSLPGTADVSPTGAAIYTIPISLPPGTAGMVPNLSIAYSSQSSGGMLGQGWTIGGFSAITRMPTNLHDDGYIDGVNFDASDQFALDGNRLVSVGTAEYRTQMETFAKITSSGTIVGDPASFVVETKDGKKLYYGTTSNSRFLASDKNPKPVLTWLLDKAEDAHGNYYTISYVIENNEYYPKEIKYTGNAGVNLSPYNTIKFHFDIKNVDDRSFVYVGGSKMTSSVVLRELVVEYENSLVKKYNFVHKHESAESGSAQGIDIHDNFYLSEIILSNASGEKINSTKFTMGTPNYEVINQTTNISNLGDFYPGDFNGDGKSDLFIAVYKRDVNGNIEYETPLFPDQPKYTKWQLHTTNDDGKTFQLQSSANMIDQFISFFPGDFNGDGLTDLLKRDFLKYQLYISTGDNFNVVNLDYDIAPFNQGTYVKNSDLNEKVDVGDFNGDGISDWVVMNCNAGYTLTDGPNKITVYTYDPSSITKYRKIHVNEVTNASISKHLVADFNGNGKADLMVLSKTNDNSSSKIYEFGGAPIISDLGTTLPNVMLSNIRTSSFPTKDHIIYPGDFNGDGKTDLLTYVQTTGWELNYSEGNGFVPDPAINSSWAAPSTDQYHNGHGYFVPTVYDYTIGDFNGDGRDDIIKQYYQKGDGVYTFSYARFDYLFTKNLSEDNVGYNGGWKIIDGDYLAYVSSGNFDFNGDGKADFLMGSIIDTENRDIITFHANNEKNLLSSIKNGFNKETKFEYYPYTNNKVYLAGTGNDIANDVIELRPPIPVVYKLYRPDGTGGNGFNWTKYWYQGLKFHKKGKGLLGFETVYTDDNFSNRVDTEYGYNTIFYNTFIKKRRTYLYAYPTETIIENKVMPLSTTIGKKRYFPYVDWKVDKDIFNNITVKTDFITFDDYGNVTSQVITHGTKGTTEITNQYIAANTWCPSAIKSTTVKKTRTGKTSDIQVTSFDYYPNGSLKEHVKKGITTTYLTNIIGLPDKITISALNEETKESSINYDNKWRFVVKETNPLGFVTEKTQDPKNGNVLTETDILGHTARYSYDAFGNLQQTTLPDGNKTTITKGWSNGTPTNSAYFVTVNADGKPPLTSYYTHLGQEVQTETNGFNGTKIYVKTEYNTKGQLYKKYEPSFSSAGGSVTTYDYYTDNRIRSVASPTGTTYYGYGVKTSSITDPSGKSATKTINVYGDIVLAHDNGGDIVYQYNSAGLPETITMPGGANVSLTYDLYGNKKSITDPDAGTINYTYDAFGHVKTQFDSNGNMFTMDYDVLGRVTSKSGPDGITSYTYETSSSVNGFGQLKQVTYGTMTQNFQYDGYGRLTTAAETIDGTNFEYSYTYDQFGRVSQTTYPKGKNGSTDFTITNIYNAYGYLEQIKKTGQITPVWKADAMNALGQYKQITKGNGKITNYSYDAYNRPDSIKTTGILEFEYNFEKKTGNLLTRKDLRRDLTDRFTYDNLDRLEYGYFKQGINAEIEKLHLTYSTNGNIKSKNDVGNYVYDLVKLHAVTKINDAVESSLDQNITYTAFRKVADITEGTNKLTFTYGSDYHRRKTILNNGTADVKTKYFLGSFEEEIDNNGNWRKMYYIPGGDGLAAVYVVDNIEENIYYTYTDYLGSILAVTKNNEPGIHQEQSFDPWGRRRNPNDWSYASIPVFDKLDRGYTGHQHLYEFGIINMNGRLYDPLLGRMLSPDPHIQSPGYTQNYNRYSYVFNNPLKYTDPNGEWVLQALGSIARMYIDGSLANGFEFNPLNWNWKSADTWTALYSGYQAGKALGTQWEANYNRLFGGKNNAITEVPGANYMNAYSLLHGMAADGGNGWDPTQATEPVGYTTEYMNLIGEVSVNPENAALRYLKDPNSFHNSKIGRALYPDAWLITGVATAVKSDAPPYAGGSVEFGYLWLQRGPLLGEGRWVLIPSAEFGFNVGAGIKYMGLNYLGPIDEIDFDTFKDYGLNLDMSYGVLGIGAAWSPDLKNGKLGFIGRGGSFNLPTFLPAGVSIGHGWTFYLSE